MGAILNEIEEVLMHYGMPRRSGRYPWGSGENPYQHSSDFLSRVYELRKHVKPHLPQKVQKRKPKRYFGPYFLLSS